MRSPCAEYKDQMLIAASLGLSSQGNYAAAQVYKPQFFKGRAGQGVWGDDTETLASATCLALAVQSRDVNL
jgi:hypothetical protein